MNVKRASNTLRAYRSAWKIFCAWCEDARYDSLPASTEAVCNFAVWTLEQGLRLQTAALRLKAVAHYHREAKLALPTDHDEVRELFQNARRELKERPRGKAPITPEQVRKIVKLSCETLAQKRNRTMLLIAFASGWRRSELVALDREDVEFVEGKGMGLVQRFSKTDQEGKGRYVGIHYGECEATCPVRAMKSWLALRGEWQGPLFPRVSHSRTTLTRERLEKRGDMFYMAIKEYVRRIDETPARYGAHSTRSGMVTAAAENGASIASIKLRTGHRDTRTLERYIRPVKAFAMNPLKGVL
jgi:site-specific recombinase XerD